MTISNSSEESKWHRVEGAPVLSYLEAARRDSDGRYVLRFEGGATVALTAEELVCQWKALAKMAEAGIAMLLPDPRWNSHRWYDGMARPVIWACEEKEGSEGGEQ